MTNATLMTATQKRYRHFSRQHGRTVIAALARHDRYVSESSDPTRYHTGIDRAAYDAWQAAIVAAHCATLSQTGASWAPHETRLPSWKTSQCEVCGRPTSSPLGRISGRCTNGRCLACHLEWCTSGGEIAPGHGRRWPKRTCQRCGEPVTNDGRGSWVDATDGDGCGDAVHTPCGSTAARLDGG